MFCSCCPNLVILAWTRDKLSRGQASAYRTHRQTDAANDNTRRPKLASGKNENILNISIAPNNQSVKSRKNLGTQYFSMIIIWVRLGDSGSWWQLLCMGYLYNIRFRCCLNYIPSINSYMYMASTNHIRNTIKERTCTDIHNTDYDFHTKNILQLAQTSWLTLLIADNISIYNLQYIPRNMHTVTALICFVVVIHWLIFPYPSGLLHWHCGNLTIAPVPAKQPWWIWINTSCEFIMNDCITTTKQSTTKPCAYFLGYTVYGGFIVV